MDTHHTYKCTNCNYSVQVSGKPDARFVGSTETVVCNNCHELYDKVVEWMLDISDYDSCEHCNESAYEIWDYKNKACPMCKKGKMEVDENGLIMMVD